MLLFIMVIAALLTAAIPIIMKVVANPKNESKGLSVSQIARKTWEFWKNRPVRFFILVILFLLFLAVTVVSAFIQIDNRPPQGYKVSMEDVFPQEIVIKNQLPFTDIYYTLDGTDPETSPTAQKYEGTIMVYKKTTINLLRKWFGISLNTGIYNVEGDTMSDTDMVRDNYTSSDFHTPEPTTPVPITPTPITPAPITPAPVTPEPTTPVPEPQVVYPSDWDTQFKPGLTAKEYNLDRYKYLRNLDDDNKSTMFDWLILLKERNDNIPELTANFNNKSVGSIRIRNGNLKSQSDYYYYSRATKMTVQIYYNYGDVDRIQINIPDIYTTDYQDFSLGKLYTNVDKIEFWLDDFNYDENNTKAGRYIIYIADIQFYDQPV